MGVKVFVTVEITSGRSQTVCRRGWDFTTIHTSPYYCHCSSSATLAIVRHERVEIRRGYSQRGTGENGRPPGTAGDFSSRRRRLRQ